MDHCYLLIEHTGGKIRQISYELVTAAKELQKYKAFEISALILGRETISLAESFASQTGLQSIALEIPELVSYQSEIYKAALLDLFNRQPFTFLLAGHSTLGLDIVPALAVRSNAGCLTGIEGFKSDNGTLLFRRSICGGKLETEMICKTEKTVLTIQPGSFKPDVTGESSEPKVIKQTVHVKPIHIEYLETRASFADNSALKEAKIIVAAGRGIEEEENLELIRRFARIFARSAVAGSRPLCDLGWLEYNQQVGVTGATVSPDLYIACGISGTSQHITGMKGSGYIVSINKDPNSAMFNISDLCIIEDIITFIPILLEEYEKRDSGT